MISKHKIKNLRHRQSSTVPTIKARSSYSISVLKLEKRSCVNATDEKEDNDHKPQSPANRRSAFVAADMHSISMVNLKLSSFKSIKTANVWVFSSFNMG